MESYNTISSKAIRKKVKNAESIALKRYQIDDSSSVLLDLDKVLNEVYCSYRPVSADYDTRKELVKCLNAMAREIYGNSKDDIPVLEAYGSFVMDMFSPQSDLDVSINFGDKTSEILRDKKIQILRGFAEKLRSLEGSGHVRNVVTIFSARVPIVKFFDQGTSIECDLSVENKDGILNSQIIHIISQIDDRFQKLCMLVKCWAKAHEVNSALHRTLNSVSITLLVAFHLQTQDPPILPPFSMLFKDGIDPPNVKKRTQTFLNWGRRNNESLGKLFATFFIKLQSVEFLWRQGLCVSVMNGLWISKKWKKTGIRVEDFTDVSQNVTRQVNDEGAKKIYSSINRTVEDLFEFLNGKVTGTHLRNSLFGHQAVVGPPPPVPQLSVHPQSHNNCRNGFNDHPEEHHIKRVCLEKDYKAVERTGHGRVEKRYENQRNRYAGNCSGFEEFREIPRFGVHNKPLDDPYRQIPLNAHLVHHRHDGRFSGEEPTNVHPQSHNNCRDGFNGRPEEHYNKRVRLENSYNALERTGHGREEERYENLSGKRIRYAGNCNGFEEFHEISRFGIHSQPLDDPYRQVPLNGRLVHHRHAGRFSGEEQMPMSLWQDYRHRIDPPLPPQQPPQPPPYGRARYENITPQTLPQPYFGRPFY